MSPIRVIHWGTGRVGMPALRGILERPDLELVGLFVSSPSKVGKDAGELCGYGKHVGIKATNNRDSLIALDADCVLYAATDVGRIPEVIEDFIAILESGKNIANVSIVSLVTPKGFDQKAVARIQAASEKGKVSFYTTGIHPGVVSDELVFGLSSMSQQITSINCIEMLDCSSYDWNVIGPLGFGYTEEEDKEKFSKDIMLYYWSPAVRMLAEDYGVEIDDITFFREYTLSTTSYETIGGIKIKPGQIEGIHYRLEGMVKGKPTFIAENYERLHANVALDKWPTFPGTGYNKVPGGYRVFIKGVPNMQMDVMFDSEDPLTDALIGTGMRAVHSIPLLIDAKPGIVYSFHEMPRPKGHVAS